MTAQLVKYNVLLIGDSCVDEYVFVENKRTNPEGDAPLLTVVDRLESTGMVHNVFRCLRNLRIGTTTIFPLEDISVKTRYIDTTTGKQRFRVDKDLITNPIKIEDYLLEKYDCIVISDYNKGYISTEVIKKLQDRFHKPIFLDTKKSNLHDFAQCFIKINHLEAAAATYLPAYTVITEGKDGAQVIGLDKGPWPALDIECVDVCGAGDAFLAGYVYGYLETGSIARAVPYGIVNSGISVTKAGTYAPLREELEEGLEKYAKQCG